MKKSTKEFKVYGDGTKGYKNFFSLLVFFKPYWALVTCGVIIMALCFAVSIITPIYSAKFIASLTASEVTNILIFGGIMLGSGIVNSLLNWINWSFVINKLTNKVSYDLQMKVIDRSLALKMQNFDKSQSGFFLSVINGSTTAYVRSFITIIQDFLDIISTAFFMGFTMFLNIWLGLYIIAALIIKIVISVTRTKIRIKNRKKIREKADIVSSFTNETLRGIRDIKASHITDEVYNKNAEMKLELVKMEYNNQRNMNSLYYIESISYRAIQFGFVALMAYLLLNGNVLPVIALTVWNFYGNIMGLGNTVMNIVNVVKDIEFDSYRINQVLSGYDFGFEKYGQNDIDPTKPKTVEFNKVTFAYKDEYVIQNMSFKIKENTTIGIVGQSGAGKSTMIKLLSKMYDVNAGEIRVADTALASLSKAALRKLITVVPQEPYIFNMSFKENLKIVVPEATDEEICEAFKNAQLYDFIIKQKDGLDTVLGENGLILSGGQKQRLAIARALLTSTPILILDEATSSLDNENQEKIKKVIASLSGKRTIIIIAHRLSTIIDADEIMFIKDGKVFKRGTHAALMEKCKEYKELYKQES